MSKDFIHPPCKRFGRTVFENTGFNTVRAHHSLQKDGCTRMESLKFLARKNCKIDSSIILMGPKKHNILRFKPNKNLCINGWDYGEKQYETKEPNRDTLIEQIRNGDEMMKKLEDYDDKMRENNLYNFGYQDRFVQLISNQFKLPQNKEQKIQKILALKKQMRKINKQNQETHTKISQQDIEIVDSTSRMMSSTKRSNYQLPIYSENDSIIQKCDTENNLKSRETESPNLKSITDFKNKIFGNYIKRVSKQNSQPTLLSTQTSYRQHCKPLRNLLLCSGIQLGESKTNNIRDKSYYTRAVFFPTESNIAKHSSLQQSQYQF